jgi:hypothetical protein
MVNDRLVCFDEVFEMVMNSSINVTLPPNFINPLPKNLSTATTVTPPGDDGKQKGGKKRKSDEVEGEHITKNATPISKFLLIRGEMLEGLPQVGRHYLPVRPLAHPWQMLC